MGFKTMRMKAEDQNTDLKSCLSGIFRLVKRLTFDSNEVEGGRCMRESDGKLCFCEME